MRREIDRLRNEVFDVVVIGGGMHGAWVALRAAQAGYRVALLERHDFGAATSANSLKILHGGLRYLQHLDFVRMRSSIRARRAFAVDFPEWVAPLPCVMPLQAMGVRSPWVLGPALFANDLISADRNAGVRADARLPGGSLISASQCSDDLAPLTTRHPAAGAVWWDALGVDTARLALMPVIAAADAGAAVANHLDVTSYLLRDHAVCGVSAVDRMTGEAFDIRSRAVVNVTGPWIAQLSEAAQLPVDYLPPGWVGGMNLVLHRSLGLRRAVALSAESKASDRSAVLSRATRELFFVPWRKGTLVGTDYVPVAGVQDLQQGPPPEVVAGFVEEVARVAPNARITMDDVAWVHWGLLPLAAAGDALPSKRPVLAAGRRTTGASGLVVVVGEKLTSAPELSKQALKLVRTEVGAASGGKVGAASPARVAHSDDPATVIQRDYPVAMERLKSRYGDDWRRVAVLAADRPELWIPVHPEAEILAVEVVHAIRHEMALDLDDLVLRRLGLGDAGHPGMEILRACAAIAAAELGWSDEQIQSSVLSLDHRLRQFSMGAGDSVRC